ncbi:MAG: VTT domain-containing protein [Thiogranum sp.]|nr:VTT domain-containing protein [Thiogranum sp.]
MKQQHLLKPGRNCWRIRRADRVAFLIDPAPYFETLYDALNLAHDQVLILSWDIYSRLRLIGLPDRSNRKRPDLTELLNLLVERHPDLQFYLLNWDYSVFHTLSREWLPAHRLDWSTHAQVHFKLDDQVPIGSSHHQKVVVIDDALAFSGGIDLTRARWDTSEHRRRDARRKAVDGSRGRPYHDVQMAVSGPVAGALGDLARERWRRATGQVLPRSARAGADVWPTGLTVDLEDVDVAIARTEPISGDYNEVREVEHLYLDAIAAAERYIYIENQYFTAPAVAKALAARLAAPEGPDIIITLPLATDGWFANLSMDVMRVRLLKQLRAADRHQRLAIYYPHLPERRAEPVNLHSKLFIMDDRFLRIGSANLNNRSFGLDTECDLAIEARAGQQPVIDAIRALRNRLLGEHLQVSSQAIEMAEQRHQSLRQAIESLRSNGRSLHELEPELAHVQHSPFSDAELIDPERPVSPDTLLDRLVAVQDTRPAGRRVLGWLLALFALLMTAVAAWHFSDMSDWVDAVLLSEHMAQLRSAPASPLILIAGFVIAGFLLVPLTVLVIVTAVVFGPFYGFAYAFSGALASAIASYAAGTAIGRHGVRKLVGKRINIVSHRLGERGLLAVMVSRVVPVAPFTVINLVAGASHIRLRDFTLGTALGMIPGMFAIVLLVDRATASLRDPGWTNVLTLILVSLIILVAGYLLSRQLLSHTRQNPGSRTS